MIRITVEDGRLVAEGHANFDVEGKDVVCAAVSAILQSMGYLIVELGGSMFKEKGYLEITWKENDCSLKTVEVLIESLKSIERRYPDHVKLEVI